MESWLIFSVVIAVALVAILIAFIVYKRKSGEAIEPDYRAFFIIGITWIPLGLATDNPGFWGMGAVMMVMGLANRDKWKDQPKWSELSPERRRLKLVLIIGLTVLLALGVVVFLLAR